MRQILRQVPAKTFLYVAWGVSLVATISSLYFSEYLHLPPCVLCWWQRIFMYPLVLILAVGLIRQDRHVVWNVLPLAGLGTLVAFYHNLLYYGLLPEAAAPCSTGVSCTTRLIDWFGFISIPLLSLLGFLVLTISLFMAMKATVKEEAREQ